MMQRWSELNRREQLALLAALAVCALALVWWALLAPAIHTLRFATAERQRLDAQLTQMHALQAQARTLQAQTPMSLQDAVRALESSVQQQFGNQAQLTTNRTQATLTLKAVPAQTLTAWLAQARVNARARIVQAQLTRSASATGAVAGTASWDGKLVLELPEN